METPIPFTRLNQIESSRPPPARRSVRTLTARFEPTADRGGQPPEDPLHWRPWGDLGVRPGRPWGQTGETLGRPWGQTEFQVNLKLGLTPPNVTPPNVRSDPTKRGTGLQSAGFLSLTPHLGALPPSHQDAPGNTLPTVNSNDPLKDVKWDDPVPLRVAEILNRSGTCCRGQIRARLRGKVQSWR